MALNFRVAKGYTFCFFMHVSREGSGAMQIESARAEASQEIQFVAISLRSTQVVLRIEMSTLC